MKLQTAGLGLFGTAVLFACLLGCGGNGGNGSSGGGDPALVGTWIGTEVGYAGSGTWTFSITASGMDVKSSSGEGYKGTYTADTSVDPKRFAGTVTECPAPEFVGKPVNGIYKIEGTTLTFAGNIPGDTTFPTSFTSGGAHQTRVFTLTKQ